MLTQDTVRSKVLDLQNMDLGGMLMGFPTNATIITLLSETPGTDIVTFQARTGAGTVQLDCPSGQTYNIYVTSAILDQHPGCVADYTQWFRFPCTSGSGCSVDWTT